MPELADITLALDALPRLPADVLRPQYAREDLTAGIVHIGLGNFHRAHQAWYTHRLMQQGLALDWAIVGAGVRPADATQRDRLAKQDYLTSLIELAPDRSLVEVTGAMIDFVPVETGNGALIARMSQPDIRIVALTVTEGGYFIDPVTKAFDADHPDIQHDLAHPDTPKTAFGAMIAALRQRRASGVGPFTCMCCDNLQNNGAVLRQTLVSLAEMIDADLADWIAGNCSFPNAMVDCIVPATGEAELAMIRDFGIADAAPVTHEDFRQWVIEDDFCAGRPAWDQVGAIFTDDVHPFEAIKIRILNGGHQILANAGEILSVETIAGCMAHPLISGAFEKIARDEIKPHLPSVPGIEVDAYIDLIKRRFANRRIFDTTRRVAFDGSARHPGFLLPSVRDGLQTGAPVRGLALAEAMWARMCTGVREDGSPIAPNDPAWEALTVVAAQAQDDPSAWLKQEFYGTDLASASDFATAFADWMTIIKRDGVEAALATYVNG